MGHKLQKLWGWDDTVAKLDQTQVHDRMHTCTLVQWGNLPFVFGEIFSNVFP